MKLSQQQVQHLLLRSGFGDSYQKIKKYTGQHAADILKDQLKLSAQLKQVRVETDYMMPFNSDMSATERQEMIKVGRNAVKELNSLWLKEMATSASGIREKMAFFWHDHFACRSLNPIFMQGYLDVIREHALGNFGVLLREVSKTPAMLQYLNNQQNKKTAPNENFAREVMELFTLGRDQGYTERDISEAARAFTGWGIKQGEFTERSYFHDQGIKEIMGRKGNFNGDDVLDMLLENKQTARHIARKWVRFFVNYNEDEALVERIAEKLYQSNYDIQEGLTVMFTAEAFYEKMHMGVRIKSPIELIASVQRQLHVQIEDQDSLIFLQRMMGQTLFDPPNVAGWPDGKDWVDSSTLMFRMNLPQLLFKSALIQTHQVASFDDNDQFKIRALNKLSVNIDFASLEREFRDVGKLSGFLLQLDNHIDDPTNSSLIDQVVNITSKPEFQLC